MAEPLRSPVTPPKTTITDLDEDCMVNCAKYLSLRDVCNLAMTSPALKRLAYSDSIWQRFFRSQCLLLHFIISIRFLLLNYWVETECRREQWHQQFPLHWSGNGAREVYLARYAALRQFKFLDPFLLDLCARAKPCNHLLLCENSLFFSQVGFFYQNWFWT